MFVSLVPLAWKMKKLAGKFLMVGSNIPGLIPWQNPNTRPTLVETESPFSLALNCTPDVEPSSQAQMEMGSLSRAIHTS